MRARYSGWGGGLLLALLFLALAWATLGAYGITCDEPENFLSGDLYLRFFFTADQRWLQFETLKNAWAGASEKPFFYIYTFARQERYPPVANLVSAFTGWLLNERLGWADPIVAHHAAVPLFGALGVLVTFLFAWQSRRQLVPALVAGLALALFPLYWGHTHNNIKDIPMAALFGATLWASWRAWGEGAPRWRWAVLAGALWGLALGTKANGWLIPPIVIVWLAVIWVWPRFRAQGAGRIWKNVLFTGLIAGVVGGVVLLLIWPYLWADPLRRLYAVLRYFVGVGKGHPVFFEGQTYLAGQTLPWRYAITYVLLTMPLVTLVLAGMGLVRAGRETWRGENTASALWLIWLGITLGRVSLPGAVIYDGLRQIMELLPVLCLMAGLGGEWLWTSIVKRLGRPRWLGLAGGLLVGLWVVLQIVTLARLHPYEGAFFNALAGGPAGASGRYTLEYWGQSYKDGATWLNQHAGEHSWVAVAGCGHLARFYLRSDLHLKITERAGDLAGMGGEGYVMFMHNYGGCRNPDALQAYCEMHCSPVYTLRAGGAAILSIYRWQASS